MPSIINPLNNDEYKKERDFVKLVKNYKTCKKRLQIHYKTCIIRVEVSYGALKNKGIRKLAQISS